MIDKILITTNIEQNINNVRDSEDEQARTPLAKDISKGLNVVRALIVN
jgi:hypothetical protein